MAEKTAILRTIVFRGEVAGNVVSWEQSGERRVGYWLGREYWGKGIATAALEEFLAEVKTRPLHARVVKSNVGSLKVLQKCGFEICGEEAFCDDGVPDSEFILILQKPFG